MTYRIAAVGQDASHGGIRRIEHRSIFLFVESCSEWFAGRRVLDWGAGKQPYRQLVEDAGGTYEPWDRVSFPANVSGEDIGDEPSGVYGAILCNQVMQYLVSPVLALNTMRHLLSPVGALVMTYPTCWDEVEPDDLHRFTRTGMERLLFAAGFTEIVRHERRAEVELGGFRFPLGYGVVARA